METNPFSIINDRLSSIEGLLQKIQQPNKTTEPPKINEGGIELAQDVLKVYSRSTIYKMTMENSIPHEKRGKKLWFKRIILEKWLADGMPKHSNELAAKSLSLKLRNR